MLKFDNSFFEDEVREGFYVPSMMKKAWAAELTVMYEVDKICKNHNISYYTDWGTMLGAVRHGGFIPWDDDFDIMMRRKDYEQFLRVASKELPKGFAILNLDNTENFWYFLSRIVLRPKMCFDEEYLKQFHGFPYIAGIDIFILDTMCCDKEKENQREKVIEYILAIADALGTEELSDDKKEKALLRIEQICKIEINHYLSDLDMRMQLYQLVRKLMCIFENDKQGNYVQLIPHAVYRGDTGFPKHYYRDGVRIPFENIELTLPARYETMLQKKYGNYMRLIRNVAGHNYPFFQSQKESFEKILGYELPQYKYPGILPARNMNKVSYKHQMKEYLSKFKEFKTKLCSGYLTSEVLVNIQENAINVGNLIEKAGNEEHPVIQELEQFCEVVFELYSRVVNNHDGGLDVQMNQLKHLMKKIEVDIEESILKRKEIVFLPFNGKYWPALHSVWEAAASDPDYDVFTVPLPYFYKEYDGRFLDMVYDLTEYPADVPLTDYRKFDLALHQPDIIFIQNPYDEWNSMTSIPKEFYSAKIRNYTEKLIYIPYFQIEEFDKKDEREYWNMQYYCTVPGVVNADQVFVQSERMKEVYVEKLIEFAGEATREVWERKIVDIGSPLMDYRNKTVVGNLRYPSEWNRVIQKPDGSKKKVILYYISMSSLVQYKIKMVEKVRRVFKCLFENKADIVFIWKEDPMIDLNKKLIEKNIYTQYKTLQNEIISQQNIIYTERMCDDILTNICDAYYGMPSAIGNKFHILHKPVMLCDVEI